MEVSEVVLDDSKFEFLKVFLATGSYPEHMKGNPGLKSNLRRQAAKFCVRDGVLFYKYRPHRKDNSSKYWLAYQSYFILFCNA
jgi:hypothetical protein